MKKQLIIAALLAIVPVSCLYLDNHFTWTKLMFVWAAWAFVLLFANVMIGGYKR